MLTKEVIRTSAAAPLHMRRDSELDDVWVSSQSRWRDAVWKLDNPSIGQSLGASTVRWSMALPDGGDLVDDRHASILAWLRRFVWSLFVDPGDRARRYKTGNASLLTQGLRIVVPWMVGCGQVWPREMGRTFVRAFVDDLPSIVTDGSDDKVIKESAVYMPLKVIDLIWRQRHVLADAGIDPMPERPWDDAKGANTIAKRIITEARGSLLPIPDEVAIPLMNKAAWFLGAPAEDILALRAIVAEIYNNPAGRGKTTTRSYADLLRSVEKELCEFQFSVVDGESSAWHESLIKVGGRQSGTRSLFGQVRELVSALEGAACITIQTAAALRASEICALRAGVAAKTGLPHGVRLVETPSGLNEAFVLRSELTKGEEVPRDVDWLLGLRPMGGTETPLPVRALLILDELFEFERALAGSTRLLVTLVGPSFPRKRSGVKPFDSLALDRLVKSFIGKWVDLSRLPDESAHRISANDLVSWRESKGRIIRPHQFRKCYALFALSVDPRLLPAVQRQFHHLALAITEGAYWGRNRLQIEPLNSMTSQLTAMELYEMATGRTKAVGRMGVQLEERIGQVRKLLEGAGLTVGWRRVVRFVHDNDLHMWFAPHGGCLPLNPGNMRCHKVAGTHPIGIPVPNLKTREPSLCAGCLCFVLDRRHLGFWQKRYVDNAVAYRQATLRRQAGMFRVVAGRAEVAKKLLRRLGVDIEPLDREIQRELAGAAPR